MVTAFTVLRSSSLDRSYRNHLTERTKNISVSFDTFFSKNEFSRDTISSYLKEVTSRYTELALIAVAGDDGRVILLSKNNSILSEPEIYDLVADDIYSGKFPASGSISISEKYYKSSKFYIIPAVNSKGSLTLVYPRRIPIALIIRFILEIIAVSSITAAIIGMAYLIIMKRTSSPEKKEEKKTAKQEKKTIGSFLGTAFTAVADEFGTTAASLSMLNPKNSKSEQVFFFDDDSDEQTRAKNEKADLRPEIITELKNGSHVLREKSCRVLIPVIVKGSLCAIFAVSRKKKFTGKDIARLKEILAGIDEFL
jgi:hypothetical protein